MSFLDANTGVIRSIGGFTADVTIEEDSSDELEITQHPVEQGADITDHAYKRPARLVVHAGWSDSSAAALGDQNYSAAMYAKLLSLQASRELFDVQTGQRFYTNMLLHSIRKITNRETEFALLVELGLQQVIIVPTQVTNVPPTQYQKTPQKTGATISKGSKTLQSAPNYNPGP